MWMSESCGKNCYVVFIFIFKSNKQEEDDTAYLSRRHQVQGVHKEEAQGLDEEHIVAVLPHQQEGERGGAQGQIA